MRVAVLGRGERCAAVIAAIQAAGHDARHLQEGDALNGRPAVGVCAGWPKRLTAGQLDWPIWGWINCHAGPVPVYRGGSPLNWQIIHGHRLLGVSILKMAPGFDDGPVIDGGWFDLGPDEDISHAHGKANRLFADLVPQVLDRIEGGTIEERPQETFGATYWHQRDDSDGEIDWNWPAQRVHDFVRALTRPYPGAWTWIGAPGGAGYLSRIWKTSLDCPEIRGRPGHVFNLQGRRYAVCGDRALEIIE